MGMFSEVNDEGNVRNYEKILRAAWKEGSREVFEFADAHILPLYLDEVGETFGSYKIPDDLKKNFQIK